MKIKINTIFSLSNFWIGFYLNRYEKSLSFFPLPCFGFKIKFISNKLFDFKVTCPMCLGTGYSEYDEDEECLECEGTGKVESSLLERDDF